MCEIVERMGGHSSPDDWVVTPTRAGTTEPGRCVPLPAAASCLWGQWVIRMCVKLCDSSGDTRLEDLSTQSDSPVTVKYMECWMSALVMDRSNC